MFKLQVEKLNRKREKPKIFILKKETVSRKSRKKTTQLRNIFVKAMMLLREWEFFEFFDYCLCSLCAPTFIRFRGGSRISVEGGHNFMARSSVQTVDISTHNVTHTHCTSSHLHVLEEGRLPLLDSPLTCLKLDWVKHTVSSMILG